MGIRQWFNRVTQSEVKRSDPVPETYPIFDFSETIRVSQRRALLRRSAIGIVRAQILYDNDSYAGELIQNVTEFAVGKGIKVSFSDDHIDNLWNNWRWSEINPLYRVWDLAHVAVTHLLRDGDIFAEKSMLDVDQPRLYFINGLNIRGNVPQHPNERSFDGVVVEREKLTPLAYLYHPWVTVNTLTEYGFRRIPAYKVIHIYKSDYSTQGRGQTWLYRSLTPLEELDEFDRLAMESARLAAANSGFLTVPLEYFRKPPATLEGLDEDAQAKAYAQKLMQETDHNDYGDIKMYPPDVEWKNQRYEGFADATAIKAYENKLLTRAARGLGITPDALTGDFGERGYLSSKFALESDKQFYFKVQGYIRSFFEAVVEWWIEMMMYDPRVRMNYKGYEITIPAFQYSDPVKDATAMKIMVDLGITSPQEICRERSLDWEDIVSERKAAAKVEAEINKIVSGKEG